MYKFSFCLRHHTAQPRYRKNRVMSYMENNSCLFREFHGKYTVLNTYITNRALNTELRLITHHHSTQINIIYMSISGLPSPSAPLDCKHEGGFLNKMEAINTEVFTNHFSLRYG
jgi:hypothetical protein